MAQPDVKVRISAVDETKAAFNSVAKGAIGLKNAIFSVQGAIAGISGGAVVSSLIKTNASFQQLQASLQTFTGSASAAAAKFNELQTFASKTPFSLQELVQGFNILKSRGLDPSISSFEAFGNIASGTGKSINQLTEAIADAAVGEFERLKEFGIKANKEGDNIKFTFGGVTTQVRNNSAEILGYLEKLGNVQFAGAMERQAQTLNGAFSNFGDAVDALAKSIGEAGLNDFVVETTKSLTGFVSRLNEATKAGYGFVDAMKFAFTGGDNQQKLASVRDEIKAINKALDEAEKITPGISTSMTDEVTRLQELTKMERELLGIRQQSNGRGAGFQDPRILTFKEPTKDKGISGVIAEAKMAHIQYLTDVQNETTNIELENIRKRDEIRKQSYQVWFDLIDQEQNEAIEAGALIVQIADEQKQKIDDMTNALASSFNSAFTAAIQGGEGLGDVLKSLLRDIVAMTTKMLVLDPLMKSLRGAIAGSGFGQSIIGAIGGTFGGARAGGGDVSGGRSYLVGERGPELFIPGSSGTIMSNNALSGSSGGVTVNQVINVTTGVQQTVRAEIMTLMPQIAGAAKAAVADAKLRGGSYAAAMR